MRAAVDCSGGGFSALEAQSIQRLGMASSVEFQNRLWNGVGCNGGIRRVDRAFQTTWDASRGQALAGICLGGAEEILPGLCPLWNGLSTLDVWNRSPWSLGSCSYLPPGCWTTLLGVEGLPEGDILAGEHTWPWRPSGLLDWAVASGNRAAEQIQASLAA